MRTNVNGTRKFLRITEHMQWTDRIRQVKIILVVAAVAIAAASLFVSHRLVNDLKQEERTKMDLWAKAMKFINEAEDEAGLTLALEFIKGNTTIPHAINIERGNASKIHRT